MIRSFLPPSLLLIPVVAFAQQSTPAKESPVTFGGYLDFYFQYDFGRPKTDLNARLFDIHHNKYDLAEADFDILKSPSAKDPLGFTFNLIAGKNADLLHSSDPSGRDNLYKFIGQGYVTYQRSALTLDLGKFYTWIGYESYYGPTQVNYGRGIVNTLAQPDYHVGARLTYALNPKLTGNAYAVNGWNEDQDSNHDKSFGLGLTYAPDSKTGLTVQDYFGTEGSRSANGAGSFGGIAFPNAGKFRVHLLDIVASRQVTSNFKVAANADYATAANHGSGGAWDGEAVYLQGTLNKTSSATLRLERMHDSAGLRTGTRVLIHSITGTLDFNVYKNVLLRLELRHDIADVDFFPAQAGMSRDRTTITFAQVLHF